MKTHVVHLVSHKDESPEAVLEANGLTADHICGMAAFTVNAKTDDGEPFADHRFAVLVIADSETAHNMELQGDIACSVMDGLTDRFRELMLGIFGEDVVRTVMLAHFTDIIVAHVPEGGDDDDDTLPNNRGVLN
jgi:hypothetical protein